MPISRWISVSDNADMIAPDLTLALQAATYQGGMPTHNSSQATTVGPFQRAKGVPAFMASANSSCLRKFQDLIQPILATRKQRGKKPARTCA